MSDDQATSSRRTFAGFWLPVVSLLIAGTVITLDALGITDSKRQAWELVSGTDRDQEERVKATSEGLGRSEELLERTKPRQPRHVEAVEASGEAGKAK